MQTDEQAIRTLVDTWLAAAARGDVATMLNLLADDVLFMVPGKEPFGKKEFATANQQMKDLKVQPNIEILEIKVLGDWAWMRNRLRVTMTPPQGKTISHRGYVLTILRKNPSGQWVIYRDANLLMPEPR
jgi:uncharacterized protein (TIGR02246 family)